MSVRKFAMIFYRCCWLVFFGLIVAMLAARWDPGPWLLFSPAVVAIAVPLILGRFTAAHVAKAAKAPVEIGPPVSGRWVALNSPADKVPSHGVHVYGQTYAIDLVAEPEPGSRPPFTMLWPLARGNAPYPAFGAPVLAVADATVVRVYDRRRDHLTRTSLPALAFMMLIEGAARDTTGAPWVVGNHLILDLGNGTYAMYAHIRRGSFTVREGDRVRAGQTVARCGNSGNSTEAHVHFQLMDGAVLDTARGIPFTWRGIGVPANGEAFTAGASTGDGDRDGGSDDHRAVADAVADVPSERLD